MTRAKLSGSLLVRKEKRNSATPADLSTILHEATEKARGGPVLIWSARPVDEAAPNPPEDTGDPVDRAVAAPQATDLDPPIIEAVAETVVPSGRPDSRAPALRWTVLPAMAVAVSILAIGSVSGSLVLQPNEGKPSTEAVVSVGPAAAAEKLATAGVEPELQPPAMAATVVPSRGPSDPAAATAEPAAVTSKATVPDLASTDAPRTARIGSPTDLAATGDAPGANLALSAAGSSTPPAESPGSAALNSALLARGDALFVIGDLSSARMFYERAANEGHGKAALQLGETYDPSFLARTRFIGARPNAAMAAYWYQRARELGVPGADILLAAITAETGR